MPTSPRSHTEKQCPHCGSAFTAIANGKGTTKHCSQECAQAQRFRQHEGRDMSEAEAAWLAGLFDGEGSVIWVKGRTKKPVRIVITNTCLPLLNRILEVTGVGSISGPKHDGNPKHAAAYYWYCGSNTAVHLLRRMLPWLIVKREKAEEAITVYE